MNERPVGVAGVSSVPRGSGATARELFRLVARPVGEAALVGVASGVFGEDTLRRAAARAGVDDWMAAFTLRELLGQVAEQLPGLSAGDAVGWCVAWSDSVKGCGGDADWATFSGPWRDAGLFPGGWLWLAAGFRPSEARRLVGSMTGPELRALAELRGCLPRSRVLDGVAVARVRAPGLRARRC